MEKSKIETKKNRTKGKYESEPMNVDNLIVGELVNYKTLCEKLGQGIYAGSQKKAQVNKFFTRYFDFEKNGTKYLITEIYDEPMPAEYIYSGRTIYTKYTEVLLMSYLYSINEGSTDVETYLTTNQLWRLFGLSNNMFEKYKNNRDELVCLINKTQNSIVVTNEDIKDQYNLCTKKFHQIVRSSLDSLENRSLIKYNRCHMVKVRKEENGVISNHEFEIRQATSYEESWILKASDYALHELKLKDKDQLQFQSEDIQKSYNFYSTKFLKEHPETDYILSYWETTHIIYCADIIPRAVREDLQELNKLCINYELKKFLRDKNAKKSYTANLEYNQTHQLLEMIGCNDDSEKPKDYISIGKAFEKETLDLGINDQELLRKAAEIIKDKNMYKVYMDE